MSLRFISRRKGNNNNDNNDNDDYHYDTGDDPNVERDMRGAATSSSATTTTTPETGSMIQMSLSRMWNDNDNDDLWPQEGPLPPPGQQQQLPPLRPRRASLVVSDALVEDDLEDDDDFVGGLGSNNMKDNMMNMNDQQDDDEDWATPTIMTMTTTTTTMPTTTPTPPTTSSSSSSSSSSHGLIPQAARRPSLHGPMPPPPIPPSPLSAAAAAPPPPAPRRLSLHGGLTSSPPPSQQEQRRSSFRGSLPPRRSSLLMGHEVLSEVEENVRNATRVLQPAAQDDLEEPPTHVPAEPPKPWVCGRFGLLVFPLLVAIGYLATQNDNLVWKFPASSNDAPPGTNDNGSNTLEAGGGGGGAGGVPFVVVKDNDNEANDGVTEYNVGCEFGPYSFWALYGMNVTWTCIDLTLAHPHQDQPRRCFYTYVPPGCEQEPLPLPVVMDLHADTTCPQSHMPHTQWRRIAEQECIVMVWPVGTVEQSLADFSCWNVPGGRTFNVGANLQDEERNAALPTGNTAKTSSCCCHRPTTKDNDTDDNEDADDDDDDDKEKQPEPPQEESEEEEENSAATAIDDPTVLRFMIHVLLETFNNETQNDNDNNDNNNATQSDDKDKDKHHHNKHHHHHHQKNKRQHSPRLDPNRVYLSGHSNGCVAALGTAALHSDVVAAVCCHEGQVITALDVDGSIYGVNRTDHSVLYTPTPTWMVHGTRDPVFPYEGGSGIFVGEDYLPSLPSGFQEIANANGCDPDVIVEDIVPPDGRPHGGGGEAVLFRRTHCQDGADVVLVRLLAGHSPYVQWLDTTQMAWDFCSQYSLPPPRDA